MAARGDDHPDPSIQVSFFTWRSERPPRETWTFFCLASSSTECVPRRPQKIALQNAGLGRKKVIFSSKGPFVDVKEKLEIVYPKLKDGGGFELLRMGSPNAKLALINPSAGGYSMTTTEDRNSLSWFTGVLWATLFAVMCLDGVFRLFKYTLIFYKDMPFYYVLRHFKNILRIKPRLRFWRGWI